MAEVARSKKPREVAVAASSRATGCWSSCARPCMAVSSATISLVLEARATRTEARKHSCLPCGGSICWTLMLLWVTSISLSLPCYRQLAVLFTRVMVIGSLRGGCFDLCGWLSRLIVQWDEWPGLLTAERQSIRLMRCAIRLSTGAPIGIARGRLPSTFDRVGGDEGVFARAGRDGDDDALASGEHQRLVAAKGEEALVLASCEVKALGDRRRAGGILRFKYLDGGVGGHHA